MMSKLRLKRYAIIALCLSVFLGVFPTLSHVEATTSEAPAEAEAIPGWNVDPNTAPFGSASISSVYARTGSRSLLFEDKTIGTQPSGHFRVLSDPIAVAEGDTVTYEVYVYKNASGDQTHGVQPVIHFYTAADSEITPNSFVNYGASTVPVGEWFNLSVGKAVPAGTAYVRVGLYSGFVSLTKVYMDDARVKISSAGGESDVTIRNASFEEIGNVPEHPPVEPEPETPGTDLVNSGFELGLVEGEIQGWSISPDVEAYGSISLSSEYARTGSNSLLFEDKTAGTKPEGHFRALSNPIAAAVGDTITYNAYIYKVASGDQTHGVQPVIHYYNEAGTEVKLNDFTNYGASVVPVGEWFSVSVEGTAPAGTAYIRVGLYSGFPSLTKVYLDDAEVQILPANPEPQLEPPTVADDLINPGFEQELVNWEIPGWSIDPTTVGLLELDSEITLSGAKSLHFKDSSTSDGLRVLSNAVTVTPGSSVVAVANAYVLGQTHNIVTEIWYYDASHKTIKTDLTLFSGNTLGLRQWSTMRLLSTVPEGTAYARVALYSGNPSLTEAYFDDVSITVVPQEVPLDREYEAPVNLGEMVFVNLGQAGAVQTNAAGENEVYFVANGSPGTFFALDGETGALKFKEVIPKTTATWAMTIGQDQNVYFASTDDGNLYRYLPLERKVELLGYNQTDSWTWDLEAIDNKIYGGTFDRLTDGKLYEYDIATGTFRNYGVVAPKQQYVRGIAVDEQYIYAGLGATLQLFKVDRVTGEKMEIIIPGYSGETGFVQDVFVHNGKLFVSVSTVKIAVIDMETWELEAEFNYSNMISEPSPEDPNTIYFKYLTKFYKYDMSTKETTEIPLPHPLPDTTRTKDISWITMKSGEKTGQTVLAMVTQYGEYVLIDPTDQWMSFVALDIEALPVGVQALKKGPDGRLYMGGYQRGMSVYNPFTDNIDVNISSFPQPEGIGFLNDDVYYGTYVGAIMYKYDPSKPVVLNENPGIVFDMEHQDRPFVVISGDNKVFAGTVADYGYLTGALAIYDQATDTWKQFDNVVENQSIIALAYKDGLLYGSTSVWGGLGIDPSEPEAKMFVWDVANERKIEEFTLDDLVIDEPPRMIGSLAFGPDGLLWGVVDGTIFAMDVTTKEIVKQKMIRPSLYNTSKVLGYELEWGPDGMLYTTLSRKLMAIDPETLNVKVLYDGFLNLMTIGIDGSIYYVPEAGTSLSRIAVPETDATLVSITLDGQPLAGFSPGVLKYEADVANTAAITAEATQSGATVAVNDLRDSAKRVDIVVTASDGKSTLNYTVAIATKPPAVLAPTGLTAVNVSNRSVELSWTASEGEIASYEISRNGEIVGTSVTHSFADTGLERDAEYIYSIKAVTVNGDISEASEELVVTTLDIPNSPSELAAVAVSSSQVDLSWTAPSDAVVGYMIFRDGEAIGLSETASYSNTDLVPLTTYMYSVKAIEATGALSASTDEVSVTTMEHVTFDTVADKIAAYTASGDLSNPVSKELSNKLKQAKSFAEAGNEKQSDKFLEDMLKVLDNQGQQKNISAEAKAELTADINRMLQ